MSRRPVFVQGSGLFDAAQEVRRPSNIMFC